jgi:DNA-damage-inducible protein J
LPNTVMVHVRVDQKLKEESAQALEAMGLTVSAAVKMFLTRVAVEKALPFTPKVPNAVTQSAMAEAEEIVRQRRTRFSKPEELFDEVEEGGKR